MRPDGFGGQRVSVKRDGWGRVAISGAIAYLVGIIVMWLVLWAVAQGGGVGAALRAEPLLLGVPAVLCAFAGGWFGAGWPARSLVVVAVVAAALGTLAALAFGMWGSSAPIVVAGVAVAAVLGFLVAMLRSRFDGSAGGHDDRQPSRRGRVLVGAGAAVLLCVVVGLVMVQPNPALRHVSLDGATLDVPASWVSVSTPEDSKWKVGFQDAKDNPTMEVLVAPSMDAGGAKAAVAVIDTLARGQYPGFETHPCANSVNQEGQYYRISNECFTYQGADGKSYEGLLLGVSKSGGMATVVQIVGQRGQFDDVIVSAIKNSVRAV